MIIFKQADELSSYVQEQKQQHETLGFVPTMGALHQGHIALVREAATLASRTICSIFVNPTQFNDPSDFEKYPVTIEKDIAMLEAAGTDILFMPAVSEMYPGGTAGLEHYDLGYLETILEGRYRPGHFQGVCQVMSRLLGMVQPHRLFMGQKDYQQCMVVGRLLELMRSDVQLVTCPTVREPDGLAMSSRNRRLDPAARRKAPAIYRMLEYIRQHLRPGNTEGLRQKAVALLEEDGFKVDYITIASASTLQPATAWDGQEKLLALAAAFLDNVRLIDNRMLTADNMPGQR